MFLSLGEIMLRFCPGDRPLRAATQFTFSEGGGEYNVARALSRCFGHKSGVVTSLVDNELGHLVRHLVEGSGVDTSNILWQDFDGIGKEVRNPLYFAERGFGYRSPKAVMDRGHSAPSQMSVKDVDWKMLFEGGEVKWFHTGGIFAGLSESSAEVAEAAMSAARDAGVHVSYDPNFRSSLWHSRGGSSSAAELNRKLAIYADTLFGVAPLLHPSPPSSTPDGISALMHETTLAFPQLKAIVVGRRTVHSASSHDYAASSWLNGEIFHAEGYQRIDVLDRIGSGDAFAAGYISSTIEGLDPIKSLQMGCAAAALTMSTPGDAVLVSRQDVEQLAQPNQLGEVR